MHTELAGKFDILVNAAGRGIHGQAGAAKLGIARALVIFNAELRPRLRQGGFLTRDPRARNGRSTVKRERASGSSSRNGGEQGQAPGVRCSEAQP